MIREFTTATLPTSQRRSIRLLYTIKVLHDESFSSSAKNYILKPNGTIKNRFASTRRKSFQKCGTRSSKIGCFWSAPGSYLKEGCPDNLNLE
ncbi:unnamed protein product [Dovyalis caffra]|uniref:Uncharacterized protein n=1 Tax=Dovyalis caffra TaxID=77055 RepID=A0AAV1QPX7_9ROSI|nr:unnamed protein product [Dovyalis caffra]CAK7328693.1 unnamed protein product [Dovyalis caffra]